MNLEIYEDAMAAELPNHLSGSWNVKVTDFGAAVENDVVVSASSAAFAPVPGTEELDPRAAPNVVNDVDATMTVEFNSAAQASRTVFNNLYREMKAACNALTTSRPELWTLLGVDRYVNREAEAPTRVASFVVNINSIEGAKS